MTIIEYLETLKSTARVTILLRRFGVNYLIAATTADILLQSKKEDFRKLKVLEVDKFKHSIQVLVEE